MNNEEIIGIYEDMLAMLNQIADTNRKSLTKERYRKQQDHHGPGKLG